MKRNVSDFLELAVSVYKDATAKCTADVFDLRDLMTIRSRIENEGISFLTITLPLFCKDFERSLAIGKVDPSCFRNFRKYGAIPAFLQGMLGQVFDQKTGEMIHYENPHFDGGLVDDIPTVIESVRQICLTFKKVEIECTPERVHSSLNSFIEIEHTLSTFTLQDREYSSFLETSRVLWDNLVAEFQLSEISPKHGPGATAERISGNQKFVWRRWHDRLETYFPLIGMAYPLGIPPDSEEIELVSIVPKDDEQPVRVVQVPKTLKAPRTIAIEPTCMQFAQQGIRDWLYGRLESYWLTRGHVNFRDQSVNQEIAVDSSKTGRLATIDLSDASDRVPHRYAMEMFRFNHDLHDAIEACRSTKAHLPDDRHVDPLYKFASMGSALCFPVEAMYFYTICIVALLEANGLSCTPRNVFDVSRDVYVYGDDIIVPVEHAVVVLDHLRKYNCKVNDAKTFHTGKFRESCGVDAFDGIEVTPVYLRQMRPKNKLQASQVVSWTASANQFYRKGYWQTATLMYNILERVLGTFPYVSDTSEGLGRISFLGYRSAERWNDKLHRLEIKAYVPSPVYRTDELDGYGALSKCLSSMREFPTSDSISTLESINRNLDMVIPSPKDEHHLERVALHGAVTLKHRWVPAQ